MRKNNLIFFFLFVISSAFAQNVNIKLWPNEVPGETLSKHLPEEYTANTSGVNVHRITNITDPKMVMYKPGKNANGAAMIICAGGGNKYLAINIEGEEVAQHFTALGYTTFVLEYRVPLNPAGALQDLQRAIRLVRNNAYQWHLKSDLIGVIGFSAGGNLAARGTTGFKNKTYKVVDAVDSVSCRPDFSLLIYPGSLVTGDKKLIPEIKPTEETPPIFIFVAADDQYNVPFQLGQALRDLKLPFEFHVAPQGGHGYGLRKGNAAAEKWPGLAQQWISKYIIAKKYN